MIDRRRVATALLLALAVATVALPACGGDSDEPAAGELTKVTIVAGSPPGGKLANLVAAQERGYFSDEGIEVEISLLNDSSDALKLVGSGRAQFGLVNSLDQVVGRSRGIPIVSLATTLQGSTHGIMAPAGSGISEPGDLEGLTVGMTGLTGNKATLEDILRRAGADPEEVEFVETGFTGAEALATGTVDALGDASSWNIPMAYNTVKGKAPDDESTFTYLRYTDLGSHRYYSLNVATTESYVEENADTVQGFIRAWQEGMEWSLANPDEAAQLTVDAYPELKLPTVAAQWKNIVENATSQETDENGLGWQSAEVYSEEAEFLHENGIIDEPVDVDTIVNNDYLAQSGSD